MRVGEPVVIGENLTLWLDEEGRLKLPKPGFSLKDIPTDFAGNGVLLGGDADQVKPCHVSESIVAMGVKWLAPGEVTPPGRQIVGTGLVVSTTVDSRPTPQLPPSKMPATLPCISSSTSWALVGLGRPLRLAGGAAMGQPQANITF